MKRLTVILMMVVSASMLSEAVQAADDAGEVAECMRKLTESAKKRHAEQSENRIKRGLKPYRFTPPGSFEKSACKAKNRSILNETAWQ
ncbi:hypothetical protein [Nitrosovibrio sp. Nv6]|uniref:hypothetical protein n=1 Tax=Nitrosovibrio sp. Nv6 TaxID=1855340 RepID=UPI0008D2041C|nr:hypothetical protein [Nitrosovibrio sp. Nv6]SEP43226.1 hypothetical protein SAMN05216316_3097 [Nitrosovibrio sp. Nv6]